MTFITPAVYTVGEVLTSTAMNNISTNLSAGMGAIYDTTLLAPAATIDITSIPSTFAHLMLVLTGRTDAAVGGTSVTLRMNNDSGANYDVGFIFGTSGPSTSGGGSLLGTSIVGASTLPGTSTTAGRTARFEFTILQYAGTALNKAVSGSFYGRDASLAYAGVLGGNWASTAAINRLTLSPGSGNFVTGTRATLYGMGS